jgi:alpha-tubulin suppressor-like RCC1 family protein
VKIHFDAPPTVIALGLAHTCALDGTGALWCWGANSEGQLGNGENADTDHPVPIAHPVAGHSFVKLAAGRGHTCGIDIINELWCWGSNAQGQLGSAGGASAIPRQIDWPAAAGSVRDVYVRHDSTCAILFDGQARCWGADGHGALGAGGPTPRLFAGRTDWVSFGGGQFDLCAISAAGELLCSGAGDRGQLGSDFVGWTPAEVAVPCDQ